MLQISAPFCLDADLLRHVMTYNILDDGTDQEMLTSKAIWAAQPEIIFLQEVGRLETVERSAAALKMLSRGRTA